ncbi:alpha/beta fold hydrolase [Flavobacterium sp. NST-5]|uniref:Alpha/beta fold hydrolase n=1 Tax=Flavobacterium ichthyis TaxID=2698827 RepID=A0ABW9Z6K3_9FLAO|nr:alpha/beta hydrolase [Flavobacterium ichthyis]NBL64491.1 alpha/beta fold hydrolase [Flavobacterium ichthyis]
MQKIFNFLLAKSIGLYINLLSYVAPKKASRLAYKFFSEPRAGKIFQKNLPEILKGVKTEMLEEGIHHFPVYIWEGGEKTVLLVHGWESNASRWENFLPYLQKSGCTIIALDAPGHGLSSGKEFSVPTYAEFVNIAAEKFRPQFIVGHSMGGATTLYYQQLYQNPEVEKIVLLGAPSDLGTLVNNYAKLLSLNLKAVKMIENHFLEHFKIKIEEFSGKIFGSKIKIKGLIAHDIDDDVVAFEEAKKIAENWKNHHFIQTKGLGHSMHDESLYQEICHFLFNDKEDIQNYSA